MDVCPISFQKKFEVAENKSHCIHLKHFPLELILPCHLCKWSWASADRLPWDHLCIYDQRLGRTHEGCTRMSAGTLSPAYSRLTDIVQKQLPLNDFCLNCLLGWEWNMNLWRYINKSDYKDLLHMLPIPFTEHQSMDFKETWTPFSPRVLDLLFALP